MDKYFFRGVHRGVAQVSPLLALQAAWAAGLYEGRGETGWAIVYLVGTVIASVLSYVIIKQELELPWTGTKRHILDRSK